MPEANILGAVSAVVFAGVAVWVAFVRLKMTTPWALSEAERDALMGEEPPSSNSPSSVPPSSTSEAPALASASPNPALPRVAASESPSPAEVAAAPVDAEPKAKAKVE